MKTVVIKSPDDSVRVEAKVDIFATNEELQKPGFDTRFTAMQIKDDFDSIQSGIDINEIEHNWQSLITLAKTNGMALYLSDLNDSNPSTIEIVSPA